MRWFHDRLAGYVGKRPHRRRYVDLGGYLYPASLTLRDLISGSSVFLEFNSITPDPDIVSERTFQFEVPEGVEVKRVERPHTET